MPQEQNEVQEPQFQYRFYQNTFYPYEFKEAYELNGKWPNTDYLDLTAEQAHEFMGKPLPTDMMIGIVEGGLGYVPAKAG